VLGHFLLGVRLALIGLVLAGCGSGAADPIYLRCNERGLFVNNPAEFVTLSIDTARGELRTRNHFSDNLSPSGLTYKIERADAETIFALYTYPGQPSAWHSVELDRASGRATLQAHIKTSPPTYYDCRAIEPVL